MQAASDSVDSKFAKTWPPDSEFLREVSILNIEIYRRHGFQSSFKEVQIK